MIERYRQIDTRQIDEDRLQIDTKELYMEILILFLI